MLSWGEGEGLSPGECEARVKGIKDVDGEGDGGGGEVGACEDELHV